MHCTRCTCVTWFRLIVFLSTVHLMMSHIRSVLLHENRFFETCFVTSFRGVVEQVEDFWKRSTKVQLVGRNIRADKKRGLGQQTTTEFWDSFFFFCWQIWFHELKKQPNHSLFTRHAELRILLVREGKTGDAGNFVRIGSFLKPSR